MILAATKPSDGSVDVAPNQTIELTFSQPLAPNQALNRFVQLLKGSDPVRVSFEQSGTKLLVKPITPLLPQTKYTLYVYQRNAITKESLYGADGTTLDRTYVITFTTGSQMSDIPQYESPIFNQPINVQIEATLVDDGAPVLIGSDASVILTFSDIVVSCDCNQTIETLDGEVYNVSPSVQLNANSVLITLYSTVPNQFVTIELRNVRFANSAPIPLLTVHKFTHLKPQFGSIHQLKFQFGKLQRYLKDHEVVGYIIMQQQAYQRLTGVTLLGRDTITLEEKHAVVLLAKYLALKDLLMQKLQVANDQVDYADLGARMGDVDPRVLEYADKQLKETERELAALRLAPEVATQGLLQSNWLKSVKHPQYKRAYEMNG